MHLSGLTKAWFAVQVRPRMEKTTAFLLESKGYEHLLPTYKSGAENGRDAAEKPLFPGYVFCRFDSELRSPIITTPGVIRIVGCGRQPVCIDESEMEAIGVVTASGAPAQPHSYLMHGQMVEVSGGPLRGLRGIVAGKGQASRLIVSVTLLQRSISVEVEPRWLRPIGSLTVEPNPELAALASAVAER
jgi:transcription termination/antitermination protein NusG